MFLLMFFKLINYESNTMKTNENKWFTHLKCLHHLKYIYKKKKVA